MTHQERSHSPSDNSWRRRWWWQMGRAGLSKWDWSCKWQLQTTAVVEGGGAVVGYLIFPNTNDSRCGSFYGSCCRLKLLPTSNTYKPLSSDFS
jgi:hypothetical protein